MKKIFFTILFFFSTMVSATEKEILIKFTEENAKHWQYISDRTMGGVSDGEAILDKEGDTLFARLVGSVSTDNNGGFIQLRSRLSFIDLYEEGDNLKGVRLNVRGNDEIYHVFIRTDESRSYRDYYSATFIASNKWKIIDLPFAQFKHRFSNKVLKGNKITTFGVVAYGRNFISDISVSEIIFY